MKAVKMIAVLAVIMFSLSVLPYGYSQSEGEEEKGVADNDYDGDFLLDYGNGDTKWMAISSEGTYRDTILATLGAYGIDSSAAGNVLTICGKSEFTVGGPDTGATYSVSGTTGKMTTSRWYVFRWAETEWEKMSDLGTAYSDGPVAVAFYPDGIIPVETPEYKSSWTATGADAENSMNQVANLKNDKEYTPWSRDGDEFAYGSYSSVLYARDHAIVKYGEKKMGSGYVSVVSYNAKTGDKEWSFQFKNMVFEMTGMVIVGQYIFIQSSFGYVYKFNWKDGPGEDNANVTSFKNTNIKYHTAALPQITGATLVGMPSYGKGPCTMVYDSGSLYFKHVNGMVYCFDLNLYMQWSSQMSGGGYVSAVTVKDDYVGAGAFDGKLYIMDKRNGNIIDSELIYLRDDSGKMHGSVNVPIFFKTGAATYRIVTTYTDGLGMDSVASGVDILDFDGTSLTKVKHIPGSEKDQPDGETGTISTYLTRFINDDFKGVIMTTNNGHYKMDLDGNLTLLSGVMTGNYVSHNAPTLVNNTYLFASTYPKTTLFRINVDGTVEAKQEMDLQQYAMANVSVVDGMVFIPNDEGFNVIYGEMGKYVPPEEIKEPTPLWIYAAYAAGGIVAAGGAFWLLGFFVLRWRHPFSEAKHRIYVFFYGENYTHNTRSKRRVRAVTAIGIIALLGVSVASLCLGSKTMLSPVEAVSSLASALGKKGVALSQTEYLVYVDRAPRILAALGAGIGLSVAGAIYQAVIKNPLVEPYIMGVSSGAGTVVVAVLIFDFTFFGLVSPDNSFMVATSAIIGGLAAFGCTMFLAAKTGGKPINYVLAGIVIGLVFSAVQSLMIIKAGNEITNALSWLYGSFTGITWEQAWIVFIPGLVLSIIPIFWAKELNLVLLGEDQAQQMGLNAKRFDQFMLILASVITAFCVAFCGIIGFVGLVIPHLSRMLLGGDHRMMLPATVVLGGLFLVLADLLARILVTGFELPVGAITSIIGVPVFAYLLIKRGRSYDV